jgi:hypothetical protein
MKQALQEKKKHEVMDTESLFLINLIQTLLREPESNMSSIEYLEKYDGRIRATGHIVERLGLAEFDERRLIGWKATQCFIGLIVDRGANPLKGAENRISYTERALVDLLLAATKDDYRGFACEVLESLGLLRRDDFDGWIPAPLLSQLVVEASELKKCERMYGA